MDATIAFFHCQDEDSKAACCIAFLAKYFGTDDATMTSICKMAEALVPNPRIRCKKCGSRELIVILGKVACSKCGEKHEDDNA